MATDTLLLTKNNLTDVLAAKAMMWVRLAGVLTFFVNNPLTRSDESAGQLLTFSCRVALARPQFQGSDGAGTYHS